MFSVVISEKGGAERRETFDGRSELNIGRVQGNELMLPKGNVSKRHARLLFRDGRFIVTDLNSTNGTYVNRRRISQATIVREGDRIYIGDFVLRIESTDEDGDSTVANSGGSGPVPTGQDAASERQMPAAEPAVIDAHIVEETSYPEVPKAPRVPSPPRATVEPDAYSSARMRAADEASVDRASVSDNRASIPDRQTFGESSASTQDQRLRPEEIAHRAAMRQLVEHVVELQGSALEQDLSDEQVNELQSLVESKAQELAEGADASSGLSRQDLVRDAWRELVELGPLTVLLDDPEVSDIGVPRFDRVLVVRGGSPAPVEPPFSTPASLDLVIGRLCRRAEMPLGEDERVVERVLSSGARLSAVRPAGGSPLLAVSMPRKIGTSLDGLVRMGTISRAIATFLQQCVAAGLGILVVGPSRSGGSSLVAALAASASEPIVALEGLDDVVSHVSSASHIPLPATEAEVEGVVRVACSMPGARVVADLTRGEVSASLIEQLGQGTEGVIASLNVSTVRRALARLTGDVMESRVGASAAAAREAVASAFDVTIEVARLRDGRERVVRVSEVDGVGGEEVRTQPIFQFVVERTAAGGSVEGSFTATGAVPRLVEDLAARGYSVDTSLFTRPPSH